MEWREAQPPQPRVQTMLKKTGRPFNFNPRLAARQARLRRLQRKGLTPPTDKQSLRAAAALAVGNR